MRLPSVRYVLSLFLIAGLVVGLFASSAAAIVIESQSANTQVLLGPFTLSIEDPPNGQKYLECTVLEWRDADSGGSPDWSSTGPVGGSSSQSWLFHPATVTTTTTVASDAVTFNMEGDGNDGRCRLSVDGNEVAVLDMFDAPPTPARVVVFVRDLPFGTHTLLIETLGASPIGGSTDVAVFGGAAITCADFGDGIPAVSTWGALALGLLVLSAGTVSILGRAQEIA